ncbi:MAG: hypothetical protein HC837_13520 [Chloroflexaceae bacterium]|nr:hypothetical protein [Chloroflexaceae bacterium]
MPGVRPDFYLWRVDPSLERVQHQDNLFWREPGIIWDAKYYREREQEGAPSPPVKRMLADMHLLGEPYGVLLFALLGGATDSAAPHGHVADYHLTPIPGYDQTSIPDQHIAIRQLLPDAHVRDTLTDLLTNAHTRLQQPRIPACHGVFLDSLSAAQRVTFHDRAGQPLTSPHEELLLCPKPHIGPWRVDLVSRDQHCCQDPHLCHIVGRSGSHKPQRPPRNAEELLRELQHIFADKDLDDALVSIIAERIERVTRRFAEIAGVYRKIDVYTNRLRDMGMHRTLHMLSSEQQESLALAVFLVEQLDSIGATDYSAPAIHISSVIETVNRDLIFKCPNLVGFGSIWRQQTLGTLEGMRSRQSSDSDAHHNWRQITAYTAQYWHGNVLPDEPEQTLQFDDYVEQILQISRIRNDAAHTKVVTRDKYQRLFLMTCQSGRLRIGALNALLLAWRTPPDETPAAPTSHRRS